MKFDTVKSGWSIAYRDISGPEYEWAMKMGQWPMSHSFACKNQDFDGPYGKNDGPKKP